MKLLDYIMANYKGYVQARYNVEEEGTGEDMLKKIADKLSSMFKTERENYEKYWEDISGFIKFGCMSDPVFYDKIKDCLIYKTTMGKYVTLSEYLGEEKKEAEMRKAADELRFEDAAKIRDKIKRLKDTL